MFLPPVRAAPDLLPENYSTWEHALQVLGVSGTMEALGAHEWSVMNRYGIEVYTHMPSVYGDSNFRFLDASGRSAITVEGSADNYFQAITEEVKTTVHAGRAAIVFFKDSAALTKYVDSPYYKKLAKKNLLLESQTRDERDYVIKKAATAGQVRRASLIG
eukprot:4137845-Pyramimonas_sp.AAC.1